MRTRTQTEYRNFLISYIRDKMSEWDEEMKKSDESYKHLTYSLCINFALTIEEARLYIRMAQTVPSTGQAYSSRILPTTKAKILDVISEHISDWGAYEVNSMDARKSIVIELCDEYDASFNAIEKIFADAIRIRLRQIQSANDKRRHLEALVA